MWLVWLVFSVIVVFILSALWWIRIIGLWKFPDGRDWLWGNIGLVLIISDQIRSVAQSCPTLCDPVNYSVPGFPVLHYLLESHYLISTESMMPSNHLILCFPLLLLPSTFACLRVFSSELAARIRWPNYWSFSFSTSPSNENSGLISFRIDWLNLLAVQGTLKRLLQHHSS